MGDLSQPTWTVEALRAELEPFSIALSPHLYAARQRVESGEVKLTHYTTAENALNILTNREVWLRNVRCMNDYSEVVHGVDAIVDAIGGENNNRRDRLLAAIDRFTPSEVQSALVAVESWLPTWQNHTFIACLSEHEQPDRDYGWLSMWRAYGRGTSGVALVLNAAPFMVETDLLKAFSVPVTYMLPEQVAGMFDSAIEKLLQLPTPDIPLPAGLIHNIVFLWLQSLFVGLKHPAFSEEREWRVFHIPRMGESPALSHHLASIGGLPQEIYRLPLKHAPEVGLFHADPDALLHQVIIGPSEYPVAVTDAIVHAMGRAGVNNPEERVCLSRIPLRRQ